MTPQRPQSEMLIRRLVQLGMPPALVLYHQKAEVAARDRILKGVKASIKSILFRGSISERIRRVRLSMNVMQGFCWTIMHKDMDYPGICPG